MVTVPDAATRLARAGPVLALALRAAAEGVGDEWRGCAPFVRALGHAGVFAVFVSVYVSEGAHGLAREVTAATSLAAAVATESASLLGGALTIGGLAALDDLSLPAGVVALGIAACDLLRGFGAVEAVEAFAQSGHVALLLAGSLCDGAEVFPIAAIVVAACHARNYGEVAAPPVPMPVAGLVLYACCDAAAGVARRRAASPPPQPLWPARSLWECERGVRKTAAVCACAGALVAHGTVLLLQCAADDDRRDFLVLVHALHVAGIVAVCVLVYPQISPRRARLVCAVLVCAPCADTAFSLAELAYASPTRAVAACLWAKVCTAPLVAATLATVEPLPRADPLRLEEHGRRTPHVAMRLLAVALYIGVELRESLALSAAPDAFARAVHLCFIVGGLALEASLSASTLPTRLARLLAVAQASAGIASAAARGAVLEVATRRSFWTAVALWCALPWHTADLHSALSFAEATDEALPPC